MPIAKSLECCEEVCPLPRGDHAGQTTTFHTEYTARRNIESSTAKQQHHLLQATGHPEIDLYERINWLVGLFGAGLGNWPLCEGREHTLTLLENWTDFLGLYYTAGICTGWKLAGEAKRYAHCHDTRQVIHHTIREWPRRSSGTAVQVLRTELRMEYIQRRKVCRPLLRDMEQRLSFFQ